MAYICTTDGVHIAVTCSRLHSSQSVIIGIAVALQALTCVSNKCTVPNYVCMYVCTLAAVTEQGVTNECSHYVLSLSCTLSNLTWSLGAHCTGQLLLVIIWRAGDDAAVGLHIPQVMSLISVTLAIRNFLSKPVQADKSSTIFVFIGCHQVAVVLPSPP